MNSSSAEEEEALVERSREKQRTRGLPACSSSSSSSQGVSASSSGNFLMEISDEILRHLESEGPGVEKQEREKEKKDEKRGRGEEKKMAKEEEAPQKPEEEEEKTKEDEREEEKVKNEEREKKKKEAGREEEEREERVFGSSSVSDGGRAPSEDLPPSSAGTNPRRLQADALRQEKEATLSFHGCFSSSSSRSPFSSPSITPPTTASASLSSSSSTSPDPGLNTSSFTPTVTAATASAPPLKPASSLLPSSTPSRLPSLFASCSLSSTSSSSSSPLLLHPLLLKKTDLKNLSTTPRPAERFMKGARLPSSSSLSSSVTSFTSSSSSSQFFSSSFSTAVSSVSPPRFPLVSSSRLKESLGSIIRSSCSPCLLAACAELLASLFESFWKTQGRFSVFPPPLSSSSSSLETSVSLFHRVRQLQLCLQENVFLVYQALDLLGRSNRSCYVKFLRSSGGHQESLRLGSLFREVLSTVCGEAFIIEREEGGRHPLSGALAKPCTALSLMASSSDKRKKNSRKGEEDEDEEEDKRGRKKKTQILLTGWESRQKVHFLRSFFRHSLSEYLQELSSSFVSFFLFGGRRDGRDEAASDATTQASERRRRKKKKTEIYKPSSTPTDVRLINSRDTSRRRIKKHRLKTER